MNTLVGRRRSFLCLLALAALPFSCSNPAAAPESQGAAVAASEIPASAMQTDVLVVGGTPSGVAAAVAAARQGAKVILVEPRERFGGDIVYALLNMFDVPMSADGSSPMARGIFGELFRSLGIAFDVQQAEKLIEGLVKGEANITSYRGVRAEPVVVNGRVVGAKLFDLKNRSKGEVSAEAVVDATNDADFAAKAGAGFSIGRQKANPDKAMQSCSLLFEVTGVNWNALKTYVRGVATMPAKQKIGQEYASDAAPTKSREVPKALRQSAKPVVHRLGGVDGNYIWERGDLVKGYIPFGKDMVVLSINFGQQESGNVILNTLNIVGVNGLDTKDRERAKQEATAELGRFLPYLRAKVPGFGSARLVRAAPELYVRETRHLDALYTLTVADIRAQRRFFDRVGLVSYPIDLHPYKKGDSNPFEPERYYYTLPLRALVPKKLDGIFVASRCLGATYEAAGSARVIPATMAAGQASGVAAAQCAVTNVSPWELTNNRKGILKVQGTLGKMGAEVGDYIPRN